MADPYLTLGVATDADDQTIHQAYLDAVRTCPPEHDPQRFEAVRHAYETLRTRPQRVAHALFDTTPPTAAELLSQVGSASKPVRPELQLFQRLLRGDDP